MCFYVFFLLLKENKSITIQQLNNIYLTLNIFYIPTLYQQSTISSLLESGMYFFIVQINAALPSRRELF